MPNMTITKATIDNNNPQTTNEAHNDRNETQRTTPELATEKKK